ncbi:MAG: helix-turn-helix domain-containing protein [Clostridia bacterium]
MAIIEEANMLLKFENLTIKILKISHGVFYKPFQRHRHGKNFYELHYTVSGGGTLVTDEGEFELEKGMIYMTGPLVYHEQLTDTENPTEEYCIQMEIIPSKKSDAHPAANLLTETHFWIGKDFHNILPYFESISEECMRKRIGYIQSTISLVSLILVSLVRNYSHDVEQSVFEKSSPDYKKLNIVEGSFFNDYRTLTLEELSQRLNLSPRQTQRFLEKNYSKSFSELKSEARLNIAKKLIREGWSIHDAAVAVGYSDARSIKNKL